MADAAQPRLTVVIPTHNRPALLARAVESALAQTMDDVEVIVVDDGSDPPSRVPADDRVRLVRLPTNGGTSAARNVGLWAAQGRYVSCLDDDDELLPRHAERAIRAIETSSLPPPVAVVCGMVEVTPEGAEHDRRIPPVRPRGCTYLLEPNEPGRSHNAKGSLVAPVSVLRSIGGWNETYRSRVWTELFLRLNPHCSIDAVTEVTYRAHQHEGPRLTEDPALRRESFRQLIADHHASFRAHPQRYADLLWDHAVMSVRLRDLTGGARAVFRATSLAPRTVAGRAWGEVAAWASSRRR